MQQMAFREALRFALLPASHPSAEHCISNALALTKFGAAGGFLTSSWGSVAHRQHGLSLLPREQTLHFCLLAPLWEGERAGQDCILRQKCTAHVRKIGTCSVDLVDVCPTAVEMQGSTLKRSGYVCPLLT